MAVHTFSTQEVRRPEDTKMVQEVEAYCKKNGMNFSALVVKLLREYHEESVCPTQTN